MSKRTQALSTILIALLVTQVIDFSNLSWIDGLILLLLAADIILEAVSFARRRS